MGRTGPPGNGEARQRDQTLPGQNSTSADAKGDTNRVAERNPAGNDNEPSLRPYQAEVVAELAATIAEPVRALLVAPTGSGKTIVAAATIADAVNAGRRVLFLAHRRE